MKNAASTEGAKLSPHGRLKIKDSGYVGVIVGPWKIASVNGGIYVGHEDGEGGMFKVEQLEPFLRAFWREHF